ncbi:hypothetical protein D9756_009410 [Leucocoprinus leucothites]|uniref:Uncharacterized protein n=1 Tax=Leucocoprinus leucothites TaxID=201217 RepID=A0A8H5CWH8_9AGAR|nr:hypothetical protein D9756_009410 [Leucoagaricus leucothites]
MGKKKQPKAPPPQSPQVTQAPEAPKARPLRLVLLGDPGVGKSSFLNASKGDAVQSGPWSDSYGIKKYSAVQGSVRIEVQIYDPRGTSFFQCY